MKKYIVYLLCFLIICFPTRVKAEEIMNIVYSDIVAYIDDRPIQSFNIDGKTFIFAEDLNKYGFDVKWVESIHALSVKYNPLKEITTQYEPKIEKNKIGDIIGTAAFKDMDVCIEGEQPLEYRNVYNIRGKTALWLDDLAKYYGKEYTWENRTLKLTLSKSKAKTFDWRYDINWREAYNNLNNIKDNPPDCKSICQLYRVANGNEFELQLEYVTGRKESAFDFLISSGSISVSFYQNDFEELEEAMSNISGCANINYNEREVANTPERKEEVSKKFRVFVNDEQIEGEFYRGQGNGHVDYSFKFDKEVALEDIQTIRIEIGNNN